MIYNNLMKHPSPVKDLLGAPTPVSGSENSSMKSQKQTAPATSTIQGESVFAVLLIRWLMKTWTAAYAATCARRCSDYSRIPKAHNQ
jgi:hypothetical protein